MARMLRIFPFIGAIAVAGALSSAMAEDTSAAPAATPPAAEAAAADAADNAVRCVSLHQIRQSVVVDDSNILLYLRGGDEAVHVALKGRCPGLKISGGYEHSTSTADLCRTDTLRVHETHGMGSVCMIESMTKITKEEADALRKKD